MRNRHGRDALLSIHTVEWYSDTVPVQGTKTYGRGQAVILHITNPVTREKWVPSLMTRPIYPGEISRRYLLNRRPAGLDSQKESFGEENLSLAASVV
jgi:hypothetical protein